MLDIHCHILPGVDDGSPDDDTSIEMGRLLVSHGFTAIAASPHLGEGPGGDVTPGVGDRAREHLKAVFSEADVPLELLPNAENHVTPALFERIEAGEVVSVGGSSRWLLVELPWSSIPQIETVMFRLQATGYKLVLAHPERYQYVEPDLVERLVDRGIKMQLEIGSFSGVYGGRAKKRALKIADAGHAHVLATDLHRPKGADKWLQKSFKILAKRYGEGAIEQGLTATPRALVEDAEGYDIEPFGAKL